MAIPTVIGTPTTSNAATSITVTLPTGSAAGDLVFAFVHTQNQALLTTAGASPKNINASDSGWKNALGAGNHFDTGGSYFCYLFTRVLDGTTGLNVPQTSDSGVLQAVTLITVRGAKAGGSYEIVGVNGTTDPTTSVATITGISTGSIDRLIIGGLGLARDSATQGWNATWTDASLASPACTGIVGNATATGNGISTGGFFGGAAASGGTGTITNTTAVTSTVWEGIIVAVPGLDTPTGALTLAGSAADAYTVPTQTATAQVALAAGATPTSRIGHILQVRARVQTTATHTTLRALLYQGATQITTVTLETPALGTAIGQYGLLVPDAKAATISDYTNLSVKLWAYSSTGDTPVVEVEEVWLALPPGAASHADAPSGQLLLARGAGAEASTSRAAPAGALLLLGQLAEASSQQKAPTGNLTLAGRIAEASTRADAAAGQITLAGRVAEASSVISVAAGKLVLAGGVADASAAAAARAGALILAGSLADSFTQAGTAHADAPAGTLALADRIAETSSRTDARTGSLLLAGARAEASTAASAPAGNLALAGRLAEASATVGAPSGLLALAGRIAEASAVVVAPTGNLVLAGSLVDSYSAVGTTTTATGQVALQAGGVPITRTGHSLHIRARTTTTPTNVVLRAVLFQGASNISGTLTGGALTSSFAEYTLAVSDAAAATISDYTALSVQFSGYSADGESATIQLADLWLDIPHQSVSHADAPSGSLILAARMSEAFTPGGNTHADAPTGVLVLSGGVVEFNIAAGTAGIETPSGTLILAGQRADASSAKTAPAGKLILSGAVADGKTYADAPAGAVKLAGAATQAKTGQDAPAGALALAGPDALAFTARAAPAGALVLSGSLAESYSHAGIHTDTPSGALVLSGVAADTVTYRQTPDGRLTCAGPVSQSATYTDAPVATIVLGARRADAWSTRAPLAGTLTLGGSLAEHYTPFRLPSPPICEPTTAVILTGAPTAATLTTPITTALLKPTNATTATLTPAVSTATVQNVKLTATIVTCGIPL